MMSKKEKRIQKFIELTHGIGDTLVYDLKRYKTHNVLKNIDRLSSFLDEGKLYKEEADTVRDVLKRLRKVAYDFDNNTVERYINEKMEAFEHNEQ